MRGQTFHRCIRAIFKSGLSPCQICYFLQSHCLHHLAGHNVMVSTFVTSVAVIGSMERRLVGKWQTLAQGKIDKAWLIYGWVIAGVQQEANTCHVGCTAFWESRSYLSARYSSSAFRTYSQPLSWRRAAEHVCNPDKTFLVLYSVRVGMFVSTAVTCDLARQVVGEDTSSRPSKTKRR
jgi:hypothetical protein